MRTLHGQLDFPVRHVWGLLIGPQVAGRHCQWTMATMGLGCFDEVQQGRDLYLPGRGASKEQETWVQGREGGRAVPFQQHTARRWDLA